MASLVKKNDTYYALVSAKKKKKWVKIGKVSVRQAKQILKNLELLHLKEEQSLDDVKSPCLYEYLNAYLDYVSTNKSTATLKRERLVINAITSFFGNILLADIESLSVERYKARRKENGLNPAAIKRELQVLSCMLNKAIEWRLITTKAIIKKITNSTQTTTYISFYG